MFRNARSLAFQSRLAAREVRSYCSFCKKGGALLPCGGCPRAFHLVCLGLREPEIPAVAWFCVTCQAEKERKLGDELERLVRDQRTKKRILVRDLRALAHLDTADSAFRQFSEDHPECIRQGKICYPIEDSLLLEDPLLHQVDRLPLSPKPPPTAMPPQLLGDLLAICDFSYTFQTILALTSFAPDQLYLALLREVVLSLVCLVSKWLLSKESTSDVFTSSTKLLRVLYHSQECVQLQEVAPYCYLVLLADILHAPACSDFVEENSHLEQILQSKSAEYPLEDCFFRDYSPAEKAEILLFLINCALDCKEIHEELTSRLEAKERLTKERHEILAELKALEAEKLEARVTQQSTVILDAHIDAQTKRLEAVELETDRTTVRTSPIGSDRLYMKTVAPIDGKRGKEQAASGYWYTYAREMVPRVAAALSAKGLREGRLLEALKPLAAGCAEPSGEESLYTTRSTLALVLCDYQNPRSQFPAVDNAFAAAKSKLRTVENQFADYLTNVGKYWESDQEQLIWRHSLKLATSADDLKPLLKSFAVKSKSPFKLRSEDSEDTTEQEDATPRKYRKVALHIWQDLGEAWQAWLDSLERATTGSHLAALVCILDTVIRRYMKNKATASPQSSDSHRMQTRQSTRRQTASKVATSSSDSHDSICFLCRDAGELILCEGCCHVVHPQCIGLSVITTQDPPDEDWFCDGCMQDAGRVTRSRAKRINRRARQRT